MANYKHKKSAISLNNNISFISKTGQEEVLNKGVQDLKYSLNTNILSADLTLQHLYDISRSIKRRLTAGIGISYAVLISDVEKVRLGISYLRERGTQMEGEKEMNSRMSGGVDFTIKLLDNVEQCIFVSRIPLICLYTPGGCCIDIEAVFLFSLYFDGYV